MVDPLGAVAGGAGVAGRAVGAADADGRVDGPVDGEGEFEAAGVPDGPVVGDDRSGVASSDGASTEGSLVIPGTAGEPSGPEVGEQATTSDAPTSRLRSRKGTPVRRVERLTGRTSMRGSMHPEDRPASCRPDRPQVTIL